jgi:hypothetical protein
MDELTRVGAEDLRNHYGGRPPAAGATGPAAPEDPK